MLHCSRLIRMGLPSLLYELNEVFIYFFNCVNDAAEKLLRLFTTCATARLTVAQLFHFHSTYRFSVATSVCVHSVQIAARMFYGYLNTISCNTERQKCHFGSHASAYSTCALTVHPHSATHLQYNLSANGNSEIIGLWRRFAIPFAI